MGSVQFGDNFRGFDASIFREGPGNDLQRLRKFLDSVLFKACTRLGENITPQLAKISKISRYNQLRSWIRTVCLVPVHFLLNSLNKDCSQPFYIFNPSERSSKRTAPRARGWGRVTGANFSVPGPHHLAFFSSFLAVLSACSTIWDKRVCTRYCKRNCMSKKKKRSSPVKRGLTALIRHVGW